MYITVYGCKNFPGGIYVADRERTPTNERYWCTDANQDQATSIVSICYWVTFIVLCGLVMLSLFIGAVTMSMSESLEQMKREEEFRTLIKVTPLRCARAPSPSAKRAGRRAANSPIRACALSESRARRAREETRRRAPEESG